MLYLRKILTFTLTWALQKFGVTRVESSCDNENMLEYMPVYKTELFIDQIERITRERIVQLDIAIITYQNIYEWDKRYGGADKFKGMNPKIRDLKETLRLNIQIRLELGLPRVER